MKHFLEVIYYNIYRAYSKNPADDNPYLTTFLVIMSCIFNSTSRAANPREFFKGLFSSQETKISAVAYEDFLLAVDTFEAFCLLRAESVRGQLNGTIPSTIQGQQADSGVLIDASQIWIAYQGELADME